MSKQDVKIVVRYIIIFFFIYLAWDITRPEYLQQIKDLSGIAASSVYGSVFAVLGWVVKSNWSTIPLKDE